MKKIESYIKYTMSAAKNTAEHPKPYTYREQILRGFRPTGNPYEFNYNLSAWLDVTGQSAYAFAKRAQAFSDALHTGIRITYSDINGYLNCLCKPKSEKRDLLQAFMKVEEGWLAGYNKVSNKEYLVENLIATMTNPGIKMDTDDSKEDKHSEKTTITKNTYASIVKLLNDAKDLEARLGKNA